MDMHSTAERPEDVFAFEGTWREFAPIAFTNLLLTIVTLGIYRFWAKTRERRYLWGRTRFIDEKLEWTGTGKEMFLGFLVVMAAIIPTFLIVGALFQALILRGHVVIAPLLMLVFYAAVFYLFGVALFRALRYRLSRTYWHGIRGGSDAAGWRYGVSSVWKTFAGGLAAGLLIPWSMVELWNERWNSMSFGQYPFQAGATTEGLFKRWLILYAIVFGCFIIVGLLAATALRGAQAGDAEAAAGAAGVGLILLIIYLALLIGGLTYYAAFYRQVVGGLSLAGIDFTFTARSMDWLKLILGSIGLVIVTLGIGAIFLPYRNWSFFIRHLGATGEIDPAALTQSTTRAASDAEGLASAFDIGAI